MKPNKIPGLYADTLLTASGWEQGFSIYFDLLGRISSVRHGYLDPDLPVAAGPVIPGMVNIHSHAFQRGMVGRTQSFSNPEDDFWSWRKAMYEFAAGLTPDSYRTSAEVLYREMVVQGYTTVCEFHYLHNDPAGNTYDNPAAMSIALIEAACAAGIRLCLLPVLYMYGGFDRRELTDGQLRFGNSSSSFLRLMDELEVHESDNEWLTLGYAPHSLRAVSREGLEDLITHHDDVRPSSPIHIHVAEQVTEVKGCMTAHNARPIEYLYDIADVDARWCLIHATHVTDREITSISDSRATVGLCPTTESDLGDGTFPLRTFVQAGGRYGIGSDSNVSISPGEEFRCLESMQRSSMRVRNVDGKQSDLGIATVRYQDAVSAGLSVSGYPDGPLIAGAPADLVVLNPAAEILVGKTADQMLNAHLLSGSDRSIDAVIIAGRRVV